MEENKKTFRDLNIISPQLLKALDILEFTHPTEIQEKAIPVVYSGLDCIGQAQTGTGKTFSYAIPIIESIDTTSDQIQALVLCPTRELALQVYAEFIKLVRFYKAIRVVTIYGGQSIERQIKDLKAKPQIIIGTPGRVIDHMNRKTLRFGNLRQLVLDEADEMLKMGFQEDLETILKETPKERQTVLFSATMPPFCRKIASNYQNNPVNIKIESKTLTVEAISQYYYEVSLASKMDLLIRVLDYYQFKSAIIFSNTKKGVDEIVTELQKNNYIVDGLHGDLKQMNRDRVMNSFREGNIKILVATDVAARGIDVNDVEAIINFDLPLEDEIYVHRIGRTGRAGKKGMSLSFITRRGHRRLEEIEYYTKSKIERKEIPSITDIKKKYINKVYEQIIEKINSDDKRSYSYLVNKLLQDNYDVMDIINALFELSIHDEMKEYNEIIVEPKKTKKDNKKENDNKSGKKKSVSYEFVAVNIGKKEELRPVDLLDFAHKQIKIPRDAIGDIKIRKSGTSFEIKSNFAKKIFDLNGKKYKGVLIKVRKVSSID